MSEQQGQDRASNDEQKERPAGNLQNEIPLGSQIPGAEKSKEQRDQARDKPDTEQQEERR